MGIIAVLSMNVGLWIQNYAEWRGGGPTPPAIVEAKFADKELTPEVRKSALAMISIVVAALSAIGLSFEFGWLIACVSAALIANALLQLFISIVKARLLPGTVSGLIFMLPSSIWCLMVVDNQLGWIVAVIGPVLSLPVLLLNWRIAFRIS